MGKIDSFVKIRWRSFSVMAENESAMGDKNSVTSKKKYFDPEKV